MTKKTSVYITDKIRWLLRLEPYGSRSPSAIVSTIADRYTLLISIGQKKLQNVFTAEELEAMYNVCSAIDWTPATTVRAGVLINIEDANEAELLNIDKKKLIEKLSALSPLEQFALVEKIEAYWDKVEKKAKEAK